MKNKIVMVAAIALFIGTVEAEIKYFDQTVSQTVATNYPKPLAIGSLDCLGNDVWRIVVTNQTPFCRYRLLSTDDLSAGFTTTGEWVNVGADAPEAWTNEFACASKKHFWRAEATWGIVPSVKLDPERVGVATWSYMMDYETIFGIMKKQGLKNVQLSLTPFFYSSARLGLKEEDLDAAWADIKSRVASGEIRVFSTMMSGVDEDYSSVESITATGGILPDDKWEINKTNFTRAFQMTQELGVNAISFHAGIVNCDDEVIYSKCVSRMTELRNIASEYGVSIWLETGPETADELLRLLTDISGIYLNFDAANFISYEKGNPIDAIKPLLPYIKQMHVKDATYVKQPGDWVGEELWGEGDVGSDLCLALLEGLGFDGNYVIEREVGNNRADDIYRTYEALVDHKDD